MCPCDWPLLMIECLQLFPYSRKIHGQETDPVFLKFYIIQSMSRVICKQYHFCQHHINLL